MHPRLMDYLEQFVSQHKRRRFDLVLAERTRHLTVVLEDIYDSHNACACLRNCESFGVQDVHIIENGNKFEFHRDITLGSAQWLTVHRYHGEGDNTRSCLRALKRRGYRVIAATPSGDACPLEKYDARRKTALVFGREQDGLSPAALESADGSVTVPLCGFTESLNLSVALALCLHHLTGKLRETDVDWQLTGAERLELRAAWIRTVLKKRFKSHVAAFYRRSAADVNEILNSSEKV